MPMHCMGSAALSNCYYSSVLHVKHFCATQFEQTYCTTIYIHEIKNIATIRLQASRAMLWNVMLEATSE